LSHKLEVGERRSLGSHNTLTTGDATARVGTVTARYAKLRYSIGVARISSGVHFFPKKVDDLFLVVALSKTV